MKKTAYIFDLDGTLCDCKHRLHHITPPAGLVHFKDEEHEWKPDWESFYKNCDKDTRIEDVCVLFEILNAIQNCRIIIITGRPESCREQTEKWLVDNFFRCPDVYMRANGDHRPDYEIKREIYENIIKHEYDIIGIFEDRKQCVDMWRKLGLICYQVANGDY